MPYSSAADLPANVKKLPDKKQRQFMHVFNGCMESGKAESKCFAIAHGVVKKDFDGDASLLAGLPDTEALPAEIEKAAKDYQYVDSWEYESRQLSQEEAGYDPVGGDSKAACSNCYFFVSPARCTVVRGVIAPNGVSGQWRAIEKYVPEPLEVRVVKETSSEFPVAAFGSFAEDGKTALGEKPSLVQRIVGIFRIGDKEGATPSTPPCEGMLVTRQKDGRLRWIARYSNSWEDRDREILVEDSQKSYVEMADKSQVYPELWLWHTPGTRFGQADWLDFADGFAFASGLIDKEKEYVVEALEGEKLGVSHGFLSVQEGQYITKHFTFEISVLPLERAAVWTTDFNVVNKETEVALTAEKRAFLVGKLGEEAVKSLETNTEQARKQLQDLGTAYKESQPPAEPDKEKAELQETVVALTEQVKELTELVGGMAKILETTRKEVAEVKKSDDEKVEESFLARVQKAASGQLGGVRPTASKENEVDPDEAKKVEKALGSQTETGDFLTDHVFKSVVGGGVSFAGAAAAAAGPGKLASAVVE